MVVSPDVATTQIAWFAATVACLVTSSFACAEDDLRKDPEVVPLLTFVSDATTLDAMFYSVRDYCLPHVGKIVISPAEQAWKAKTNTLMEARDGAMERYADILRQRGYNDLTSDQLRQATVDMFERAKANNKILRTVVEASNKSTSCGNALGAMNATSFSFERLAPNSYAYWIRNFKP
jgi:hypothetical protein